MTTLDFAALFLILFAILTITIGIVVVHTYPGKVAKRRNHPQADAIEVTSLLGLIAFPLWMFALMWAYSGAVLGKLYASPPEQPSDSNDPDASAPDADNSSEPESKHDATEQAEA